MPEEFSPNASRCEILKFRTRLRRFESREMRWSVTCMTDCAKFGQKLEWKKQLGIHRRTEIYFKRTG